MTSPKSSALTTVSTLLNRANRAKDTLGTLSGALSSAKWGPIIKWWPIIAASAIGGAITLHEWQENPLFRSRIKSTAAGAVNLVSAVELCHLNNGRVLLFGKPQNYVKNGGVTCGFPSRQGVVSLLGEYDAMGQTVLHGIAPFTTKGTTP